MSWLNNFKITLKVALIVVLMAIVTIGAVSIAALRMKGVDDAYSDLVRCVDKSTTMAVRASRLAEAYLSSAFQLLTETTDAGNAKLLAGSWCDAMSADAGMQAAGEQARGEPYGERRRDSRSGGCGRSLWAAHVGRSGAGTRSRIRS